MLSEAKNLGVSNINTLRDSSSRAAPQNDVFGDFFSTLLDNVAILTGQRTTDFAQHLDHTFAR